MCGFSPGALVFSHRPKAYRFPDNSKLSLCVGESLSACGPVIDLQPVQGVPHISPSDTRKDKQLKKMDGWNLIVTSVEFFGIGKSIHVFKDLDFLKRMHIPCHPSKLVL